MIIDLEHKFCVMTPPKTGSTSFNTALAIFPSVVISCGPSLSGGCSLHTHYFPKSWKIEEISNMRFFILTRHPYLRLMSLYGGAKQNPKCSDLSFENFVKYHVVSGSNVFLGSCILAWYCEWHYKYPEINIETLHFEQCEHIFKKEFDMNIKIEHLNKTHNFTPNQLYTKELLQIARWWGHFDFSYFDYDDEIWW